MAPITIEAKRLMASRLLAGEKLAHAAALAGMSQGNASHIATDYGLAKVWTTSEERQTLAALRAGSVVVVPRYSDPGSELARALGVALSAYKGAVACGDGARAA